MGHELHQHNFLPLATANASRSSAGVKGFGESILIASMEGLKALSVDLLLFPAQKLCYFTEGAPLLNFFTDSILFFQHIHTAVGILSRH